MKTSRILASSVVAGALVLSAPLAAAAEDAPVESRTTSTDDGSDDTGDDAGDAAPGTPGVEEPAAGDAESAPLVGETSHGETGTPAATDETGAVAGEEETVGGEDDGSGDGDGDAAGSDDGSGDGSAGSDGDAGSGEEMTDEDLGEDEAEALPTEDDVAYAPIPLVWVDDPCGYGADAWYVGFQEEDVDTFEYLLASKADGYSELLVLTPEGTVSDVDGLYEVYEPDEFLVEAEEDFAVFAYQFTDETCTGDLPVADDGAILMLDGLGGELPEEVADVVTTPSAAPAAPAVLDAAVPAPAEPRALAKTGADAAVMALVAGGLVAAGGALLALRRRVSASTTRSAR
ncbi:LPXTG-motif cell wall anchor domain-containing protein [Paraoerskovia marina]|uniref:LPXTG-motif cell wall anchor domain-containing protein n=1 Tax=Paraoerskovia marina TaxID=545619 RepID=A0A1H1NQ59_9CELL|nr:LPXTG cell wall anchor domain-containing protein [Paraoerskovia marina]SDS01102.1 LPXTG-motif cell wall anchor domain-containing protein [Paraoerskovia marina]